MNDLNLNFLGFPQANRDLTVELRDPVTQTLVRQVKPFLDGTAKVTRIPPGAYEMTVLHPNIALPVIRQPIRVLPTGDTRISVLIDPSKFRNTPIEDVPEANLGPVNDTAKSIAETVTSLANKKPGEAILAQDWNSMASAVRDLANVLGQLVGIVSPKGHNHPELEKKINEMSDNFGELLNTLSSSLTELQRQIQVDQMQQHVKSVLDQAGVNPVSPKGVEFLDIVAQLTPRATDSPLLFAQAVRNAGQQLDTKLGQLLDEKAADPNFATSKPVQLLASVVDSAKNQRSSTYAAELSHQRVTQRTISGAKLNLNLNR